MTSQPLPSGDPSRSRPRWSILLSTALGVLLLAAALAPASALAKPSTETQIECGLGGRILMGEAETCTATVRNLSITDQTDPSGIATFATVATGTFSPENKCVLQFVRSQVDRCSVQFTARPPLLIGTVRFEAHYPGNGALEPSSGATAVREIEPVPTSTTVACKPGSRTVVGLGITCTAKVTDISATPHDAVGFIRFSTSGPGGFPPQACPLEHIGVTGVTQCSLTYTPTGVGGGIHTITAQYENNGDENTLAQTIHLNSNGGTGVRVLAAPDPSKVTVSCSPARLKPNATTQCTATVADEVAEPATPEGTVDFSHTNQGSFAPASCTLAPKGDGKSASCQVAYTPTAVNPHEITAGYGGDLSHAPASGTGTIVVPHDTGTTVSCRPATVIFEGATACTVLVADEATPGQSPSTGVVKFASTGPGTFSSSGACRLFAVAAGVSRCQIVYTPAEVGSPSTHTITASYEADERHEPSQGQTAVVVTPTNNGHTTTTAVDCEPSTVILGGGSVCTVDVNDADASPTAPSGEIVFASDAPGDFGAGACQLFQVSPSKSRCQVIYAPLEVGPGMHDITAIYPGDAGHKPSVGLTSIVVTPPNGGHHTTAAIACIPATVASGEMTTCTATVVDVEAGGTTTPHGGVFFATDAPGIFNPGGCILAATGDGKSATCQVAFTPSSIGGHELKALYSGDPTHAPAEGSTNVLATAPGNAHATATTISCTPGSVEAGHSAECGATVEDKAATGATPPSGTVHFATTAAGAFSPVDCVLAANADGRTASCQVKVGYAPNVAAPAGIQQLGAAYSSDATHAASVGNFNLTVTPGGGGGGAGSATATRMRCEPATVILGGASACTATVEDPSAGGGNTPSGEVRFASDGPGAFAHQAACQLFPVSNGRARCQIVYTPNAVGGGRHTIKASYEGDAGHEPSQAEVPLAVLPPNGGHHTVAQLSCEPAAVFLGGASVCTATVRDTTAAGAQAPNGGVIFASDGPGSFKTGGCILFAIGASESRCQVIYTASAIGSGPSHTITAIYPGSNGFEPSAGEAQIVVVPPNGGHPTRTTISCTPQSLPAGSSTNCTAQVENTDQSAAPPSGNVVFGSDNPGTFGNGGCVLVPLGQGKSSCELRYNTIEPGANGGDHEITAVYGGNNANGAIEAHEPSLGTTTVHVSSADRHPTQAALACAPAGVFLGGPTATCTVTVTDVATSPTAPSGAVSFASDSPGAFANGVSCTLAAAGGGAASCQVDYAPNAIGSGAHAITASYAGDTSHQKAQVLTRLTVGGPPNTFIKRVKMKKRKRGRTAKLAKRRGILRFTSDQPGTTFQCKLGKRRFRPCRARFNLRRFKKKGRHVLRVRAVNSQGVVDPTPAIYRWRVRKAHRRH